MTRLKSKIAGGLAVVVTAVTQIAPHVPDLVNLSKTYHVHVSVQIWGAIAIIGSIVAWIAVPPHARTVQVPDTEPALVQTPDPPVSTEKK